MLVGVDSTDEWEDVRRGGGGGVRQGLFRAARMNVVKVYTVPRSIDLSESCVTKV